MDNHAALLRRHHLRPTRQRIALAEILFDGKDRHVTAEQLRANISSKGIKMSLATIYNSLNQFTDAGLLHEINLDDNVRYFDTNIDHHHHFFDPLKNDLIDIPADAITLKSLPESPDGRDIERVDVVIRLR